MASDRVVDTIEEVAAHVGKSMRSVYRWLKAGLPMLPDGRYDLDAVDAWVRMRRGLPVSTLSAASRPAPESETPLAPSAAPQPRSESPPPPFAFDASTEGGKDYWDKESKKHQARLRELEYGKRRGELIERRLVEDLFVQRVLAVRQGLVSLVRSLPPDLVNCRDEREMASVIEHRVRGLLDAYSRELPAGIRRKEEDESRD